MRIAVLGWGSLIWDSRNLKILETSWHKDGPMLPIEFARKSNRGRLTLVILPGAKPVPVLWAEMHQTSLNEAIETLRTREGTTTSNIGYIDKTTNLTLTKSPGILDTLDSWLTGRHIHALIWTDLASNFLDYNETVVLTYLKNEANRKAASEYIAKAPVQIATLMRKTILESGFMEPISA